MFQEQNACLESTKLTLFVYRCRSYLRSKQQTQKCAVIKQIISLYNEETNPFGDRNRGELCAKPFPRVWGC